MGSKPRLGPRFGVQRRPASRLALSVALLLFLTLQSIGLHAELLFRDLEPANQRQGGAPIRRYSSPLDIAYQRAFGSAPQEVRVFLSGPITPADLDSAAVMASLLKDGRQKIADNTVWLSSDGGDIDAGMSLGRLLRKLGIFTAVARNDQCLSACVFAFMGGERRAVAGRLGIHRPFFPFTQDTPDRPARFRHLQKTLRNYVEEMDFPASLYEAIMLAPPESMHFLAPAELKRFYLEGISPLSEDAADAAAARALDLTMAQYLLRKARLPACVLPVTGCDGRVPEATASGGSTIEPGRGRGDAAQAERGTLRGTEASQGTGTPVRPARGNPG